MTRTFPIHSDVNVPQVLFKYRPWNEETRSALISGELWFASPNDFNDPFEFRFAPLLPKSEADIRLLMERVCESQFPTDTKLQRNNRVSEMVKETMSYNGVCPIVDDKMRANFTVCCMSEIENNLLMWSHYADKHQGVCIGVSTARLSGLCSIAAVDYVEQLRKISFEDVLFNDSKFDLIKVARTKSIDWSYEREWRLVRGHKAAGLVRMPDEAFVSITVGCKASNLTGLQVMAALDEIGHDVKLKIASINSMNYELDIVAPFG